MSPPGSLVCSPGLTSAAASSIHTRICFMFLRNTEVELRTSCRIKLATTATAAAVITKLVIAMGGYEPGGFVVVSRGSWQGARAEVK